LTLDGSAYNIIKLTFPAFGGEVGLEIDGTAVTGLDNITIDPLSEWDRIAPYIFFSSGGSGCNHSIEIDYIRLTNE